MYHNQESGRRQYGLQEKAIALGWPGSALEIVDEDQGFSGQDKERPGLRRLMEAISSGEVGVVFCLEVSRLSRCNSAWHALIELCAWQELMLGIRGLMGASELDMLRRRMQVSREEKARRGELRFQAPTGFMHDRRGKLRLDPDEEIQEAIRLLFEQFRRSGGEVRLPREQWIALIWDAFPGYISREEYEANQRRLTANRPRQGESGAARSGAALLSGRVICGRYGNQKPVF